MWIFYPVYSTIELVCQIFIQFEASRPLLHDSDIWDDYSSLLIDDNYEDAHDVLEQFLKHESVTDEYPNIISLNQVVDGLNVEKNHAYFQELDEGLQEKNRVRHFLHETNSTVVNFCFINLL